MDAQDIPFKVTAARFVRSVGDFSSSDVGWRAKLIFGAVVALLCAATGLQVLNSYVGRNFMTAIANENEPEFARQAVLYIGVFAASTVVAVLAQFGQDRLGLLWRGWLTRRATQVYLTDGAFYHLSVTGELANPDQRIADDIRAFTVTTLSFTMLILNSSFQIISFSGVLWMISRPLFLVAVLYAAFGSFLTILLGRPLVRLNYDQLDKEAHFRSGLIHVREHAEAILLSGSVRRQARLLQPRLDSLLENFRQIIAINRNVGFFSTGYNWLIQIIPAVIVAPAFFAGKVEFGVVTQSAMVFATLVAAFSLIVSQFQSLSSYAAVLTRLSFLIEASENSQTLTGPRIDIAQQDGQLSYEQLTLLTSTGDQPLIADLSISIAAGGRVLVAGPNQAAGVALFKATAGAAVAGSGRIVLPASKGVCFLPERPYLPPGSLRQVLEHDEQSNPASNDQILRVLHDLELDRMVGEAGGLDAEMDWGNRLSLQDQQLLAFARILLVAPSFVFLDRVGASLGARLMARVLEMLSERSIGYVVNGDAEPNDRCDAVLAFEGDGRWQWTARKIP
jgi:putative ATP-binding cassette transporter